MIKQATLVRDGRDLFICVDGVKVAKRGAPGTLHAGMWISLEPGLSVHSNWDHSKITITYEGVRVH
jgi:hypothetical protein